MKATKAPRAHLEAVARELYDRHFGQQAPAKVRNAQALVALGEHRALRWRSHAYRVPPVPFRDGFKLLAASQALRQATGEPRERALSVARVVMHALVQRRRLGGWGRPRRNPFHDATAPEAVALIDWFLDVPDDTPLPTSASAGTIDFGDGLMEFARMFPALMRDGYPVSWVHYQLGLRHIGRAKARDELAAARAARIGMNAPQDAWRSYDKEMRGIAGVN